MMFDPQNYECLIPSEQRLFSRPFWPYSLHTFSLVSLVKKYATCKAKMAFQKAFISLESDVHCFSDPIINAFYNECGKDTVFIFRKQFYFYISTETNKKKFTPRQILFRHVKIFKMIFSSENHTLFQGLNHLLL